MAANSDQQSAAIANPAEFRAACDALEFDIMQAVDGQPASVALVALTRAAGRVVELGYPQDKWIRKIEQIPALISLQLANTLKQGGAPS